MADRAGSKSTVEYWDGLWSGGGLPAPLDPADRSLTAHVDRMLHHHLAEALAGLPAGTRLIEVGCAQSRFLPYFARQYGFAVAGLDYAPEGCAKARAMLAQAGVAGTVHQADMFAPPPELEGAFDVVVSFGLIEHFCDTAAAVGALARLLRPGGRIVTEIPNMLGLPGWLQRVLDPAVYAIHQPLSAADLARAHAKAGLAVTRSDYVLGLNLGMVAAPAAILAGKAMTAVSLLHWWLEDKGLGLKPNAATSPYILCVAEKPA